MLNVQKPRALVIDDEALVSVLIEDILTARGYDVTVANTRRQMEEALSLQHYALVVSDTDLATHEEMQGWNAGSLILCSGKSKAALDEAFPGTPYVSKPFSEEQFDDVLRANGLAARAT